jgi:hypothetical protein
MPAELIQIEKPSTPAIVAEMAPIVSLARALSVVDVESNALALVNVRTLRIAEKRLTELFEPSRKKADEAKKEILRLRDGLIGPIAEARAIYDSKALAYEQGERIKAEEERRRLQELARQQEEERALQDAIEAEARGDQNEAEAILAEPVQAPVIRVAPRVAEVAGVTSQVRWSAQVTDLLALVQYVAAHPQWISLLEPAMPNLNRLAVAQRDALSFPGVKAMPTTIRVTR